MPALTACPSLANREDSSQPLAVASSTNLRTSSCEPCPLPARRAEPLAVCARPPRALVRRPSQRTRTRGRDPRPCIPLRGRDPGADGSESHLSLLRGFGDARTGNCGTRGPARPANTRAVPDPLPGLPTRRLPLAKLVRRAWLASDRGLCTGLADIGRRPPGGVDRRSRDLQLREDFRAPGRGRTRLGSSTSPT